MLAQDKDKAQVYLISLAMWEMSFKTKKHSKKGSHWSKRVLNDSPDGIKDVPPLLLEAPVLGTYLCAPGFSLLLELGLLSRAQLGKGNRGLNFSQCSVTL
jgi:hypothetical protein